tara:strand:+ start:703 stop:1110 length:408 start_codon:yes stop_codon:yes gene_type:complete
MTSSYYLRYGNWNAPALSFDASNIGESALLVVTPACKVVDLTDASITTDYDTEQVLLALQDAQKGNDMLLTPASGCFKATTGSYTVVNSFYSVCDPSKLTVGSQVKIKWLPSMSKLASGETRCDLKVLDILLLEQ